VFSALVIIPAIVEPSPTAAAPSPGSPATTGFTPVPPGARVASAKGDVRPLSSCLGQPASACTIVNGTGAHLLLIGDSHAGMMIPTFISLATRHDLSLSVYVQGGCPWQRHLYAVEVAVFEDVTTSREDCAKAKDDLYDRVIPALDPDVIITMNLGYELPNQKVPYLGPDGTPLGNGSAARDAWLEETTTRSLAELRAGDRTVVLIEPIPYAGSRFDPLVCLSEASVLEECRYVVDSEPTGLELVYRELDAADDRVWSMDLDGLVCPFLPICDPIVNGEVVKVDASHLTRSFARTLAPEVYGYLTGNGVVAG